VTSDGRDAGEYARILLGAIRLFNGTAALVAPVAFARRLGAGAPDREIVYALRLFGVRTVLIGQELLWGDPALRARAVRLAPIVHVADATVAALAGRRGHLPRRAARTAVLVSATNTALALLARRNRA
jgi:hypothetical protein